MGSDQMARTRASTPGSKTHEEEVCPDCRCVLTNENHRWANMSVLCDYCLLDAVKKGTVDAGTWTDPNDKVRHLFYVLCTKCNGTGEFLVSVRQEGTSCWQCAGSGFVCNDREAVRRIARWSDTFQKNRQPRPRRTLRHESNG